MLVVSGRDEGPGAESSARIDTTVAHLAGQVGIDQFLDIGTGIPISPNVHEVALESVPAVRVVYVDNDPIVLVHARALATSGADSATAYIDADVHDPGKILDDPDLRRTLDFSRPMALVLTAVLHFVSDEDDPYGIVARLVGALPDGSYLVMSHATNDFLTPDEAAAIAAGRYGQFFGRSETQFRRFLDGMELVEPGIVSVAEWRAEDEPLPRPTAAEAYTYCAVARVK